MPTPPGNRGRLEGPPKFQQQQRRQVLFQKEDGTPLRFYIRPGPAKLELAPLILRHGGWLCRVQEPGAILLACPGEVPAGAPGIYTSTSYVTDSVARKVRLHLEDYHLEPPPAAQSKNTAEGRVPFTVAEDWAILWYVQSRKQEGQAGALGGTAFWKDMAQARVTPHPWQAMRDHYLKHLRPKEHLDLLDKNPKQKKVPEPHPSDTGAAALHDEKPTDVSHPQDQSQAAGGSKMCSIFQMANKEFEDSEGDSENLSPEEEIVPEQTEPKTSEEATSPDSKIQVAESTNGEDLVVSESLLPTEEQPSGRSAEEVAMAVKDMKRFMEEFGVDVATVTQAFLKNSGDVAAVACCLRTGQRSDGCPLWTRQDDVDLLTGAEDLRSKLSARYGAENVKARVAFRKS